MAEIKLPKMMKALVWNKIKDYKDVMDNVSFTDIPTPEIIDETDVIVQTTTLTICGTDLGIMHNKQMYMEKGIVLGHEGVGVIVKVGKNVKNRKVGDRVIISCIAPCNKCRTCKRGIQSHCENSKNQIGWIFGHLINGTHSEFVRVPFGDETCIPVPKGITEKQAVMTSDILPTTYEIGVLPGNIQKDYNVLIVGAGPIGISGMVSVLTLLGKEGKLIVADIDDERLKNALKVGAHEVVNSKDHDAAVKRIMEITNGKGVDVALECVGYPATWNLCHDTVGVGGHISVVGVHGTPVSFDLAKHWINNMTVSTGLVNANTTVDLLNKIKTGKIDTNVFINKPEHADFKFSKMLDAYHAFSHAQESKAFKVIITNDFTFNPLLVKPNN